MNKLMTCAAFIFSLMLLLGRSNQDQQTQHYGHAHADVADKKTHQYIIK